MACKIPPGKEPWEVGSESLIVDDACLKSITMYAVRYHERLKRRSMFDFCLGDPSGSICIDFILPSGLTPEQVEKKTPNFPVGDAQQLLIFLGAHGIEFLNSPVGEVHVIPEGEYGAGKWWVVQRGRATMQKTPHGYLVCIDGVPYQIVPFTGRPPNYYLMWRTQTDWKVTACKI